jgi:hypothetical protein
MLLDMSGAAVLQAGLGVADVARCFKRESPALLNPLSVCASFERRETTVYLDLTASSISLDGCSTLSIYKF